MAASIFCRLGYLISPRAELLAALRLDSQSGHGLAETVAVITPSLDYEQAFEGRKRAWTLKAKEDFVADFIKYYSADFPAFAGQLGQETAAQFFDKWWTISPVDVLDIDPTWRPS